jgi:hypothetical protein
MRIKSFRSVAHHNSVQSLSVATEQCWGGWGRRAVSALRRACLDRNATTGRMKRFIADAANFLPALAVRSAPAQIGVRLTLAIARSRVSVCAVRKLSARALPRGLAVSGQILLAAGYFSILLD